MDAGSRNIFADLPDRLDEERIDELLAGSSVTIERIVSTGQSSPPGFWYDQERPEWVILLKGSAELRFEGEAAPRPLKPGDYVPIPAHARHRVESTAKDEPTVWLAVHYREDGKP